jgi:hypothetical protein
MRVVTWQDEGRGVQDQSCGRGEVVLISIEKQNPLPMNLKIASLIINDLRILRLQGFKTRKGFRRILTLTL